MLTYVYVFVVLSVVLEVLDRVGAAEAIKHFTDRTLRPAVEAVDPWFLLRTFVDKYCLGGCSLVRIPAALWGTAQEVWVGGPLAILTAAMSIVFARRVLWRDEPEYLIHPLGLALTLLVAGVFTWALRLLMFGVLRAVSEVFELSFYLTMLKLAGDFVLLRFHRPVPTRP